MYGLYWLILQTDKLKAALLHYRQNQPSDDASKAVKCSTFKQTPEINKDVLTKKTSLSMSKSETQTPVINKDVFTKKTSLSMSKSETQTPEMKKASLSVTKRETRLSGKSTPQLTTPNDNKVSFVLM